jgi:hypothetical protein
MKSEEPKVHLPPGPGTKVTREAARASLTPDQREAFDNLLTAFSTWSNYFYGRTFVSYAIVAELVRDGWRRNTD